MTEDWRYVIRGASGAGELWLGAELKGAGYSGHGEGLNNPDKQGAMGYGPIPAGLWAIGAWADSPHLGPCVSHLTPINWNPFGRSAFFIHGDNAAMDHTASDGCIILARTLRELLKGSGAKVLQVEAGNGC